MDLTALIASLEQEYDQLGQTLRYLRMRATPSPTTRTLPTTPNKKRGRPSRPRPAAEPTEDYSEIDARVLMALRLVGDTGTTIADLQRNVLPDMDGRTLFSAATRLAHGGQAQKTGPSRFRAIVMADDHTPPPASPTTDGVTTGATMETHIQPPPPSHGPHTAAQ